MEQTSPTVAVYRRSDQGFIQELYDGLEAVIPMEEIEAELPLAELYDGVEFLPEAEE